MACSVRLQKDSRQVLDCSPYTPAALGSSEICCQNLDRRTCTRGRTRNCVSADDWHLANPKVDSRRPSRKAPVSGHSLDYRSIQVENQADPGCNTSLYRPG